MTTPSLRHQNGGICWRRDLGRRAKEIAGAINVSNSAIILLVRVIPPFLVVTNGHTGCCLPFVTLICIAPTFADIRFCHRKNLSRLKRTNT